MTAAMRWMVPSSKVGLGEADTKALWDAAGLAGATADASGFAGAGGRVWASAGPTRMVANRSVDETSRIGVIEAYPLYRHRIGPPRARQRVVEAPQCLKLQALR